MYFTSVYNLGVPIRPPARPPTRQSNLLTRHSGKGAGTALLPVSSGALRCLLERFTVLPRRVSLVLHGLQLSVPQERKSRGEKGNSRRGYWEQDGRVGVVTYNAADDSSPYAVRDQLS